MISFRNVWFKDARTGAFIEDVSFDLVACEHRALFCVTSKERKALVQLVSAQSRPDSGEVVVPDGMSFPLRSKEVLQMSYSAMNNAKMLARLYGLYEQDVLKFTDVMIGEKYSQTLPLNKLSQQEKTSILLALSYAVPFRHYIADQYALPHDDSPAYDNLLHYLETLEEQRRGLLLIAQAPVHAEAACTCGSVLHDGELVHYDDVVEASKHFRELRQGRPVDRRGRKS